MSSAAVQAQIAECENALAACEAKIVQLKQEIEKIECAYKKRKVLKSTTETFFHGLSGGMVKYDDYAERVKLARHHKEVTGEKLQSPATNTAVEGLEELAELLKREAINRYDELEMQMALKRRLENQLADLRAELQHQLNLEAEAAAAAAQAAAAAAAAPRPSGGRR